MKTRSRIALGMVGALAATGAMACGSAGAQTTTATVGAFPMPGVVSASPETQISFRGAPAAQLGPITVTGSRSGAHTGQLRAHSDGNGASFVLDKPLVGNETVSVKTDLSIPKAKDGDWTFKTATRPKKGLGSGSGAPNLELLQELTGQVGTPPKGEVPKYRSRPDLRPPEIQVFKTTASLPGFVFLAPKKVFGAKPRAGLQSGPLIVDNQGKPVWFAQNDKGNVTDFRVQQLDGQPVLTWWQGRAVLGTGEGVVQIVDSTYKPVQTIRGGNGYQLDFHETTITPQGTFLGIVYNPVRRDLTAWGGPKDARVIDSVIQEIDIKTGLVMWEWHSLGTIALDESHAPIPGGADPLWDYVHANSVVPTPDAANILVSGRELWAGVVLNRTTGQLVSRIGGKKSTYKMLGSAQFAYQHDITMPAPGIVQIFDNEAAPRVRSQSRALVLKLDDTAKTASVQRSVGHKPNPLLAGTQGNTQDLADGGLFVGWGSQGYLTQFSSTNATLFDARIARGQDTYRAYRFAWTGVPSQPPAIAQTSGGKGVYASWNGATQVASWQVLGGSSAASLAPIGSAPRSGFETRIGTPGAAYVAVQALDAAGNVLGTSKAISTAG